MKKIIWLATGGTISCTEGPEGLVPAADTGQMKKMLEKTEYNGTEVHTDCIMNVDSTDIDLQNMGDIARYADTAVNNGYDGIVITHGTDTMAYTAAYLHYALENVPIPVILTGSQRPFFTDGSDAPSNLSLSFMAAASDVSGVFIVFGGKILYADKATKLHTSDDIAFASPDVYAGHYEQERIVWNCSCRSGEYRFNTPIAKRAGLIKLSPFTSAQELCDMSGIYPDGIVIEGLGCGNIPSRLLEAIRQITSRGCRIILISQCPLGKANSDLYEVGTAAVKAGAVPADMTAEAALALLMCCDDAGKI